MSFEVRVRMPGLEKLQFTSKLDDEGALKTKVSFEVDGKIESLARAMNLQRQKQPMYCVIGCAQATFDLQLVDVFDKDKRAAQSEADKAVAAGKEPVTDLPTFRVLHLESKQSWEGLALSAEAACEQAGWPVADCRVTVRTEKGGWAKAKLSEAPVVDEAAVDQGTAEETAEPTAADNGKGEASDIGQPQDLPLSDELVAWMDANAVPDTMGFYTARCPFHDDKGASLRVWPESDSYECPVCGSSGNLARLTQRLGLIPQEAGPSA